MKKAIITVFILLLSFPSFASKIPSVCKGINLEEHVPLPPYRVLLEKERFGMCEMILYIDGNFVPVFATKDFVMSGDMWSHRKQISERDIWLAKKKLFALKQTQNLLKSMTVAEFNSHAKRFVYLITDPVDNYCENIKKDLTKLAKKYGFGIRLVFYPTSSFADASVEAFVCSHKSYKDYISGDYGAGLCQDGENYLRKTHTLHAIGVSGVPVIITDRGDYIVGYRPAVLLKDLGVKNANN